MAPIPPYFRDFDILLWKLKATKDGATESKKHFFSNRNLWTFVKSVISPQSGTDWFSVLKKLSDTISNEAKTKLTFIESPEKKLS